MFSMEEENQNIKNNSVFKKKQVNNADENGENSKAKYQKKQKYKKIYIIYGIIILLIIVIIYICFNNKETSEELIKELKLATKKIEEMEKIIKSLKEIDDKNIKGKNTFSSKKYWNERYKHGGNSGAGSYNKLAKFKAEILNTFVKENNVENVIEWGSGDGNQLSYANYKNYTGFDVSEEAIKICKKKFKNDKTKDFIWSGSEDFYTNKKAELSISLDVVFHLIEDEVFNKYMNQLFNSSTKYVIIYSCNYDEPNHVHVQCRKFTDWIDINEKN